MSRVPALKHLRSDERVALFIDGANLYQAARALEFDIDYKRLLEVFSADARLIRAYYYTALMDDQEYSPIRPLVDWLDYNGFTMVTKPLKEFTQASTGRRKYKGNMDVEIAVQAMEMAPHIDHAVLMSGDGDFRCLVEALQRLGLRVTVISTIRPQPPRIADGLRRQADFFVDLVHLEEVIARAHVPRSDDTRRNGWQSAQDEDRDDLLDDEEEEDRDDERVVD